MLPLGLEIERESIEAENTGQSFKCGEQLIDWGTKRRACDFCES